jgi:4-diphosphocytidyl-2-C-methyl-D-erythritol kinase
MTSARVFAPAKLNLFLAITGKRADGFHDLVSVVTPLAMGDWLTLESRTEAKKDTLECAMPDVPVDASNLVLKAAAAYRKRAGAEGPPAVHFILEKETPAGAGLGGGSSDAAAALRGLNELAKQPMDGEALRACAAEVGSDVPLFLESGPVVMRGRGEWVVAMGEKAAGVLRGREVVVFKPTFGVTTAWAYKRLKERGAEWYVPAEKAERQLAAWLAAPSWETLPLENNLERPVFEKYAALPVLLEELRERFGVRCRMSGSGSACFALLEAGSPREEMEKTIREAWGAESFVKFTRLGAEG